MSYNFDKLGVSKPASVVQLLKDAVDRYLPANNIKVGDLEEGCTRALDFPVKLTVDTNGGRCTYAILEDEQSMMDIFEDILNWAMYHSDDIGYAYAAEDQHRDCAEEMRNKLLASLYNWFIVTEEDIEEDIKDE